MIQTLDEQCKKEIEHRKKIERDFQEIKNFIEGWQNHLNETEDRLLDLQHKIAASDHERKTFKP